MSLSVDRGRVANAVIALVLLVVVSPIVAYAVPQAIGATGSYVVLSGSMEPTIQTGSVIYVYERPPEKIEQGDIITFNAGGARSEVTTHRVVEVVERDGTRMFVTKGDANEEPDPAPVPPDAVIGVVPTWFGVLATVPLVGHLLLFAQSDQGILLFVFVPAGLLVVTEVWDLYKAATSGGEETSESDEEHETPEPAATTTDGGTEQAGDDPADNGATEASGNGAALDPTEGGDR